MKKALPKAPRVRLDHDRYAVLHRQILERDNWRCQVCGSMQGLQVHHLQFRSHAGDDDERNLITLCNACHQDIHKQIVTSEEERVSTTGPTRPSMS